MASSVLVVKHEDIEGDFEDLLVYELCFSGAITGETEIDCPDCGNTLTVSVNDPWAKNRTNAASVPACLK